MNNTESFLKHGDLKKHKVISQTTKVGINVLEKWIFENFSGVTRRSDFNKTKQKKQNQALNVWGFLLVFNMTSNGLILQANDAIARESLG